MIYDNSWDILSITMKFYTCHDSCAVVACTKFHCEDMHGILVAWWCIIGEFKVTTTQHLQWNISQGPVSREILGSLKNTHPSTETLNRLQYINLYDIYQTLCIYASDRHMPHLWALLGSLALFMGLLYICGELPLYWSFWSNVSAHQD